jgi:D-3-phosphoglycerate dehydrogenase
MKKKVVITPRSFVQYENLAYEIIKIYDVEIDMNHSGHSYSKNEMIQKCADADGVIVGIDPMDEVVLKSANKLKAISKYGVGLDNIDLDVAKELGIKVNNAAGANSESVAELTVALMLLLARSIFPAANSVRNGGWDRKIGSEIIGKIVGIIGLGAIGREVARMSRGLGMKVVAYDPYIQENDFTIKYEIERMSFDSVLQKSDFVTLNLPLNDGTFHIMNEGKFAMMKSTAFLVNTARGELVDEEDLYTTLKNNVIAGAAEDVFSREPVGQEKLLSLDHFVLTPHIGAFTKEATRKMVVKSVENLVDMLFK